MGGSTVYLYVYMYCTSTLYMYACTWTMSCKKSTVINLSVCCTGAGQRFLPGGMQS